RIGLWSRNALIRIAGKIGRVRICIILLRMKLLRTLTISAAVIVASLVTAPAQAPARVTAFTGARVIDGTDRAPIANATLLVRDGRVVAVGSAASVTVPAGAERVALTGKTVIPGL